MKAVVLRELTHQDGSPVTQDEADAVHLSHYGEPVYAVVDWKARGLRRNGSAAGGGMTEEQKAERREVVANNRALDDANEVRREWLAGLVKRAKLAPKASEFTAATLAERSSRIDRNAAAKITGKSDQYEFALWGSKTPSKAGHVLLALAVSTYEGQLSKTSWRGHRGEYAAYLTQLAEWGYTLSEIEQTMTTK
ncbi:hypothetical protein NBM05_03675 [Rothia sp. AR01]|uniref:Uncharacterized protein n=1 Tax=Rothia santali TaxID=2949643 RepID=A0A9X2HHU7_9MICC|nr:hypothetical protein [Rothia santali]MCP3425148.1 hypothetical protein [Rothia santali]